MLQQIRDQEALCLVVRDFHNPALDTDPDPAGDIEAFHTECLFADLDIVERRLERARKEQAPAQEIATLEKMKATLEEERPLRSVPEDGVEPGRTVRVRVPHRQTPSCRRQPGRGRGWRRPSSRPHQSLV